MLAYHKIGEIPAGARFPGNYVRPLQFAAQLRLLRRLRFTSISLAHYLAYRAGDATLPPRPIVLTFDDGYASTFHEAAPVLKRNGFTATWFVVTGLLGATNRWDEDELQEPLLSADQIRALFAMGFEFQSHTCTHPHLPSLGDAALRDELGDSRRALEDLLRTRVTAIAYPWGERDARTDAAALDAGYRAGVILRRRTNFADTPMLELRRIGLNHETTAQRLAWDLLRLRWRGA